MLIISFSRPGRYFSDYKITKILQHTFVFKLIHPKNSSEEKPFLDDNGKLSVNGNKLIHLIKSLAIFAAYYNNHDRH